MSKLSENKTFMFLLRACVALLLICLVFNLFVMPSFAITSVDDYVYLIPYYSSAPSGVSYESLAFIYTYSYNREPAQSTNLYSYSTDNDSVYIVYYYSGSSVCSISLSNESFILNGAHGKFSTSFSSYNKTQTSSLNNDGLYQYISSSGNANGFPYSVDSIFGSYESAYSYLSNFVNNGGSSSGSIQSVPTDVSSITDFQNMLLYQSSTDKYVYSDNSNLACAYFNNSGTVDLRVCSLEQLSPNGFFSATNGSGVLIRPINVTYDGSNVYYGTVSIDGTLNPDIKVYNDESTFNTEMYEYLSSLPSPTPPADIVTSSSYFGVPSGYAAYIELPQNSIDWDIQVTQEFDEFSSLFGGQWDVMTSLWGFQSSLPSGNGNFSKTGLTVIPMYKQKPYTVLGQSKTGFSNKATMIANGFWSDTPSNTYLVIYNPVIRSVSGSVGGASNANNVYHYNKGISVTMEGFYSPVKYYKLESTVTTSGVESAPSNGTFEDSESTETFNTDGTSNGVVDSSGNNVNLQDGGGDLIPSATSIGDYLRNLNATISDFANNFVELLSAPISHVRQLIAAGTEYFGVIRGLYAWLPSSVQSTIESALIVSISIGVIGLLL